MAVRYVSEEVVGHPWDVRVIPIWANLPDGNSSTIVRVLTISAVPASKGDCGAARKTEEV